MIKGVVFARELGVPTAMHDYLAGGFPARIFKHINYIWEMYYLKVIFYFIKVNP